MKVVKYIDIYSTELDEEGNPIDKLERANVGIPEYINEKKITSVSPYFTSSGRLYKNVSIIVCDGTQMKVVGNYNDLNALIQNKTRPVGGFNKNRKNESTKG